MERKQVNTRLFVIWATFGSGGFGVCLQSLGRLDGVGGPGGKMKETQGKKKSSCLQIAARLNGSKNANQVSVLAKHCAIVAKCTFLQVHIPSDHLGLFSFVLL